MSIKPRKSVLTFTGVCQERENARRTAIRCSGFFPSSDATLPAHRRLKALTVSLNSKAVAFSTFNFRLFVSDERFLDRSQFRLNGSSLCVRFDPAA